MPEDVQRPITGCGQESGPDESRERELRQLAMQLARVRSQAETARKYRFIADSSRDFMSLVDREYRYEAANASYLGAMGLSEGKVVGSRVAELWGEDIFEEKIRPFLDDAFAGQRVSYEAWFDFPSLGRGYWRVIYSPYYDETGEITHVSVVSHDLTDRRVVEEALRASEQKLESIVESIPDVVYRLDNEGRFVFVNGAVRRYGWDPDELIGRHIMDIVHPEDRDKARHRVNERRTGDRSTGYLEVRVLSKAGTEVAMEIHSDQPVMIFQAEGVYAGADPAPEGFSGTQGLARDVSERKRMEALSEERNALYKVMFENSATGLVAVAPDGSITKFNPKFSELVGWTEQEVLGTQFLDYISPSCREMVIDYRRRRVAGDADLPLEYELDVLHREGHEVTLLVQIGMLTEMGTAIVSGVDISARKKFEQDMLRAKEDAERASRVKNEFLANMSHEVRTPLNGILGMAELVLMADLPEEQRENVQMIREAGRNLLSILNDLLDISRIEAGRMELDTMGFTLPELLRGVEKSYSLQAAAKGLFLEFEEPEGVADQLYGDPGRIRQILNNLVGNAIKFTSAGSVRVGSWYLDRPAGTRPRLLFRVRDTGVGMPEDALGLMFEPFTQADGSFTRRYSGTGLGLGIVRRLVSLMGGVVSVDTEPGRGTAIWFTVPLVRPASGTRRMGRDVSAVRCPASLSVLLAEDNAVNRIFAEKVLAEMGHDVVSAGNGREVLEFLGRRAFDLVLMDVQMPEMDGVEATRRIRLGEAGDAVRNVPIIAMTAHAMKGDRERFLASGMNDYVSKPVSLAALEQALGRALAGPRPDTK